MINTFNNIFTYIVFIRVFNGEELKVIEGYEEDILARLTEIVENTRGANSSVNKPQQTPKQKKAETAYERILRTKKELVKREIKLTDNAEGLYRKRLKTADGRDEFLKEEKEQAKKDKKNAEQKKRSDDNLTRTGGTAMEKLGLAASELPGTIGKSLTGKLAGGSGAFGKMTGGMAKLGPIGMVVGAALGGLGTVVGWTAGKFMNLLDSI